ncbi:hypothetical protein J1N35_022015 [Gossypium stocksii]|uniref:RNase H type-1 domain-containing protein n=1 Tax=Gossypium stocksii TaxID=47602 RepID=A0A9D4A317_9ROSI|nr:hypothetical protein J1N35_022015 [Gossypium stocksii]
MLWPVAALYTAISSLDDKALTFYGCGGVLRDKEGVARALFSGSVIANDTDLAEIGTMMVALEVFLAMKWKLNDSLFIELGSIVAFNWCANKSVRPRSLQATFTDIERDIEKKRMEMKWYLPWRLQIK